MSSEGSYPNKFLEVYNPTTSEIDLAGYALASCSNGCADEEYEYWNAFSSGATIAAGGHYVVCHPSSDTNITAACDQTNSYLSNGDDGESGICESCPAPRHHFYYYHPLPPLIGLSLPMLRRSSCTPLPFRPLMTRQCGRS